MRYHWLDRYLSVISDVSNADIDIQELSIRFEMKILKFSEGNTKRGLLVDRKFYPVKRKSISRMLFFIYDSKPSVKQLMNDN